MVKKTNIGNSWKHIIGNYKELSDDKFKKTVMNYIRKLMLHHMEYINNERPEHITYVKNADLIYPYPKSKYFMLEDKNISNPKKIKTHTIIKSIIEGVTKEDEVKRKDVISFASPIKFYMEFIINRAVKEIIEIWPNLLILLDEGKLSRKINLKNSVLNLWLMYEDDTFYSVSKYVLLNAIKYSKNMKYFNDYPKTKKGKPNINKKPFVPEWQIEFIENLTEKINISINRYHPDNEDNNPEAAYAYVEDISQLIAKVLDYFLKVIAIKLALRILYKREATISNKIFPAILWDLTYGIEIDYIDNTGISQFMDNMKDYMKQQSNPPKKKTKKDASATRNSKKKNTSDDEDKINSKKQYISNQRQINENSIPINLNKKIIVKRVQQYQMENEEESSSEEE